MVPSISRFNKEKDFNLKLTTSRPWEMPHSFFLSLFHADHHVSRGESIHGARNPREAKTFQKVPPNSWPEINGGCSGQQDATCQWNHGTFRKTLREFMLRETTENKGKVWNFIALGC
ncbi:hypothetical protein RJT34_19926 [Clitoria ternatea]|uniref:Uncharacterized protein n=1 Tax=Clitoria ternatea TaxID=43366 RepID=A0AAN9IRY4_CLITE